MSKKKNSAPATAAEGPVTALKVLRDGATKARESASKSRLDAQNPAVLLAAAVKAVVGVEIKAHRMAAIARGLDRAANALANGKSTDEAIGRVAQGDLVSPVEVVETKAA